MFNLTVDEAHTYYVGEQGWLVHNCGEALAVRDLEFGHLPDMSKTQARKLIQNMSETGMIPEGTIKYVESNGRKYVVDGNNRLQAARSLNWDTIPAEKVALPYKGFKTIEDLFR